MKKLVAILLTFLLILTGCKTVEITKVEDDIKTDSIRFKSEYKTVSEDNLYEYKTYDNIIDILNKKTGIIYLGFPGCNLCDEILPILNDASKEKSIESISYYNFKEIRDNNTYEYQKLTDILSDYIKLDDEGKKRITAPTILFVNKGRIVGVYIGSINSNTDELLTEEEKINIKNNFLSLIDKMLIDEDINENTSSNN